MDYIYTCHIFTSCLWQSDGSMRPLKQYWGGCWASNTAQLRCWKFWISFHLYPHAKFVQFLFLKVWKPTKRIRRPVVENSRLGQSWTSSEFLEDYWSEPPYCSCRFVVFLEYECNGEYSDDQKCLFLCPSPENVRIIIHALVAFLRVSLNYWEKIMYYAKFHSRFWQLLI